MADDTLRTPLESHNETIRILGERARYLKRELTGARILLAILVNRTEDKRITISGTELIETNEAFLWTQRSSEHDDLILYYREGDNGSF